MHKKGSIFIVSMWVVLFLSVLVVYIGRVAIMRVSFTGVMEKRNNIYNIINSGIDGLCGEIIFKTLAKPKLLFPEVITRSEEKQISIGADKVRKVSYNYSFKFFSGEIFLKLSDEQGKINVNNIEQDRLEELLIKEGKIDQEKAEQLSFSIIDWIDKDNERPLVNVVSNEDLYYKLDDIPYVPKNGKFNSIEELLLVKDMSPQVFEGIKQYLTVYGDGKVNINTCSDSVLEIVLNDNILFKKIKEFRMKYSRNWQNLFDNDKNIAKKLKENMGLQPAQEKTLQELVNKGIIGVDTDVFRVTGIAISQDVLGYVDCVVDKKGAKMFFFEDFISV